MKVMEALIIHSNYQGIRIIREIIRIYPKINLSEIKNLFDSIPCEYNNLPVLSVEQKDLYFKSLEYKYVNVLTPINNMLIKKLTSYLVMVLVF